MAQGRKRKVKSIPMKVGNDPSLWRYASLQDALKENTHLIAHLIQSGAEQAQSGENKTELKPTIPELESA